MLVFVSRRLDEFKSNGYHGFMSISIDTLKEAISIKESIAALEARLEKLLPRGGGGDTPSPFIKTLSTPVAKKARKGISAAGRARIAAAQRARWAKSKGPSTPVVKPTKKKGGISAEGRARLAAAMKARWSAARKKGTTPLNAGKKK